MMQPMRLDRFGSLQVTVVGDTAESELFPEGINLSVTGLRDEHC